jgi:YD repeat-containing protein
VALSAQGAVRYVYDDLGRLVGVIDASGDAAAYLYDAAGNLLGITRIPSTQTSILEFAPHAGPIGQTVTIYGTGFSATPSLNTVAINGTSAPITSASTNILVVTVPPTATTGTISVTTPSGSTNSTAMFAVTASFAPTITGPRRSRASAGRAAKREAAGAQTTTSTRRRQATAKPKSSIRGLLGPIEQVPGWDTNLR